MPNKTKSKPAPKQAPEQELELNLVIKVTRNDLRSFPFFYEEIGKGTLGKDEIRFGRGMNHCLYFWIGRQRYTLPLAQLSEKVFKQLSDL